MFVHDVDVRSSTPVTVPVSMALGAAATTVEVTGEDLVNNAASMDTDIDRKAFSEIPLESTTSGLSSLVTLSSPGVSADSNGLFHGWAITPRTRSLWMGSRSPISRARFSRISFRLRLCSRCR